MISKIIESSARQFMIRKVSKFRSSRSVQIGKVPLKLIKFQDFDQIILDTTTNIKQSKQIFSSKFSEPNKGEPKEKHIKFTKFF